MTNKEKVEQFKKITKNMAELYAKKNSNYGDSFGKLYRELGPSSGLVPLHNKLDRLTSLLQGNDNNFESIEDTFIDLANYAIMNLIEFQLYEEAPIQDCGEKKEDKKQTKGTIKSNETITNDKSTITGIKTLKDYYEHKYDFYEPYSWLPWPCCQCSRRNNRLWTWSYSGTAINSNSTYFGCFGCKHYNTYYTPSITYTTPSITLTGDSASTSTLNSTQSHTVTTASFTSTKDKGDK